MLGYYWVEKTHPLRLLYPWKVPKFLNLPSVRISRFLITALFSALLVFPSSPSEHAVAAYGEFQSVTSASSSALSTHFSHDGNKAYLLNDNGTIDRINTSTLETETTYSFPDAGFDQGFALSNDEKFFYVSDLRFNRVFKVDSMSGVVIDTITLPNEAGAADQIILTDHGASIWVAESQAPFVYKIDLASDTIVATVQLAENSFPMVLGGNGNIYLAGMSTGSISEINTTTNLLVKTITLSESCTTFVSCGLVSVGNKLWLSGVNGIKIIDETGTITRQIDSNTFLVGGQESFALMEKSYDGSEVYLASNTSTRIYVFSGNDETYSSTLTVGYGGYSLTVSPDGMKLWATYFGGSPFPTVTDISHGGSPNPIIKTWGWPNGDYHWNKQFYDGAWSTAPGTEHVANDVIIGCTYCQSTLVIPEGIVGISTGKIFDFAVSGPQVGNNVQGIIIPASLTYIASNTFSSQLNEITFNFGNLPLVLDDHAFDGTSLTSIEIPSRTTYIGSGTLSRFTNVTISGGNTPLVIGSTAFNGNTLLTQISIPGRVTNIGNHAFNGASALRAVTFEAGTLPLTIGSHAFMSTTSLSAIGFPERLISIGQDLFQSSTVNQVTFLGAAPIFESTTSNVLSSTPITGYIDTGFASTYVETPSAPNWHGLSIRRGRGALIPPPTISLISAGDVVGGSVGFDLTGYQLLIQSSTPKTVTIIGAPAGVTVDSTGLISGRPSASGIFNATVEVTDPYGSNSVIVPFNIFQPTIDFNKIEKVFYPNNFVSVGALTYFDGNDSDWNEWLWKSDGSDTGTTIVGSTSHPIYYGAKNINPIAGGVVFQGADIQNDGWVPSLYFADSSTAEPRKIPLEVGPDDGGSNLTIFQNRLYYLGSDSYLHCVDLLGNSLPVPSIENPYGLTPVANRLYFLDNVNGNLMFFGSNSNQIETITAWPDYSGSDLPKFSSVRNLTNFNGSLAFQGYDLDLGPELVLVNSEANSLVNLTAGHSNFDYIKGGGSSISLCQSSFICPFIIAGSKIYFEADGALWSSDGISSTKKIDDIGYTTYGLFGIPLGRDILFSTDIHDGRGYELQLYNADNNVITGVTDIYSGASDADVREFALTGDALFISGIQSGNQKLWTSGSNLVINNDPGQNNQQQQNDNQNPVQGVSAPDPVQTSSITPGALKITSAGTGTLVSISGKFVEKIASVQINGVAISRNKWIQSPTSLAITLPAESTGTFSIQIFNGTVPVLPVQSVSLTAATLTPPAEKPADTSTAQPTKPSKPQTIKPTPGKVKAPSKVLTIKCVRGKNVKTVKAVKAACPKGYAKQ